MLATVVVLGAGDEFGLLSVLVSFGSQLFIGHAVELGSPSALLAFFDDLRGIDLPHVGNNLFSAIPGLLDSIELFGNVADLFLEVVVELFLGDFNRHVFFPLWLEHELDFLEAKICLGQLDGVLLFALDVLHEGIHLHALGGQQNGSLLLYVFFAQQREVLDCEVSGFHIGVESEVLVDHLLAVRG